MLLVEWLNALVYEMAVRGMLFGDFSIEIDGGKLRATAYGEAVDLERHEPAVEVREVDVERRLAMRYAISLFAFACSVSVGAAVQEKPTSTGATGVLTAVQITQSVLVNGKPLPEGLYELRLTNERPTPLPGQSPDAERWVEFVSSGQVVAREVAEVLRDDDLPTVGASSVPSRDGTRVVMLKGGDFLRISVKRGRERYLIHLPIAP